MRPKAFALLIGEDTFLRTKRQYDTEQGQEVEIHEIEYARRNHIDILKVSQMLETVSSEKGISFNISTKSNNNYNEFESAIQSTFQNVRDGDTSFFFIATHGNSNGEGELEIAFQGDANSIDDVERYQNGDCFLTFQTLAEWISKYVQGEVIIVLESCGAGSSIYSEDEQNNSYTKRGQVNSYSPERFVAEAVEAFAYEDTHISSQNKKSLRLQQEACVFQGFMYWQLQGREKKVGAKIIRRMLL